MSTPSPAAVISLSFRSRAFFCAPQRGITRAVRGHVSRTSVMERSIILPGRGRKIAAIAARGLT